MKYPEQANLQAHWRLPGAGERGHGGDHLQGMELSSG